MWSGKRHFVYCLVLKEVVYEKHSQSSKIFMLLITLQNSSALGVEIPLHDAPRPLELLSHKDQNLTSQRWCQILVYFNLFISISPLIPSRTRGWIAFFASLSNLWHLLRQIFSCTLHRHKQELWRKLALCFAFRPEKHF